MDSKKFAEGVEQVWDVVKKSAKGETILNSNKSINKIGSTASNFTGIIEYGGRVLNNEGFGQAFKKTFGEEIINDAGEKAMRWNNKKIAGSFLGAAVAGRVLTGGGLYKDGNGNTNIVGLPFV